jgi:hypothetical protein
MLRPIKRRDTKIAEVPLPALLLCVLRASAFKLPATQLPRPTCFPFRRTRLPPFALCSSPSHKPRPTCFPTRRPGRRHRAGLVHTPTNPLPRSTRLPTTKTCSPIEPSQPETSLVMGGTWLAMALGRPLLGPTVPLQPLHPAFWLPQLEERLKTTKNYLLTPRPAFDTGPAMFGEPQKPILPHPRRVQRWAARKSKLPSVAM